MASTGVQPRVNALEAALLVLAAFFGAQWLALRVAGPEGPRAWPVWLAGSVAPPLVLLAGGLVIARRFRPLVPGLRPAESAKRWIGAGACFGLTGGLLVGPTEPRDLAPLLGLWAQVAWAVVWVGLCAPLVEELFFRGVLQPSIARWLNTPLAVVLAGLAFGVTHLGLQPLWLWPLLGVGLGCLAAGSRSLWPAVAAHAGWNLATVLGSQVHGPLSMLAGLWLMGGVVCAITAVLAARREGPGP